MINDGSVLLNSVYNSDLNNSVYFFTDMITLRPFLDEPIPSRGLKKFSRFWKNPSNYVVFSNTLSVHLYGELNKFPFFLVESVHYVD